VERDLRARWQDAALPPDICAFGELVSIVFGAVTDAKQRPGFPADPRLLKFFARNRDFKRLGW
jgi:hypothetical protein